MCVCGVLGCGVCVWGYANYVCGMRNSGVNTLGEIMVTCEYFKGDHSSLITFLKWKL